MEELATGDPAEAVIANARRKALAGARRANADGSRLVLGVDTDVALGGRLLGKPEDEAGARERLEALSGRVHEVLGGVALLGGDEVPGERTALARTQVCFRPLGEPELERYLASGEWRDRAGAYAIQGLGSLLVESIRGDFSNVVGLPVRALLELAPELFDGSPRGPRGRAG